MKLLKLLVSRSYFLHLVIYKTIIFYLKLNSKSLSVTFLFFQLSLSEAKAPATTNKYIAPNMREGAKPRSCEPPGPRRDDIAAIRISNLSNFAVEADLDDLVRGFGPVQKLYLAKEKVWSIFYLPLFCLFTTISNFGWVDIKKGNKPSRSMYSRAFLISMKFICIMVTITSHMKEISSMPCFPTKQASLFLSFCL